MALSSKAEKWWSTALTLILVAALSWVPDKYTHTRLPTDVSLGITAAALGLATYLLAAGLFVNERAKRRLDRRRSGDPRRRTAR